MAQPSPEKEIEEQYELPDGWVWCKLGEACEINPKSTNLSDFDQSLPTTFVPMTAVDQIEGAIKTPEILPLGKARKGHTQFIENDVIFARITPCMENGKAAIAKNLKNCLGFGSTEFHVIRPPYEIIPEYIFYFIRQESFRNKASAHFTSTVGQMRVPKAFMLAASFPLPPLSEQHRIVTKLEALLAQVNCSKDHLAKVPLLIRRFRQSVLAAACSGRLTEDWRREHPNVEPASELLNRIREERIRRYEEEYRKAEVDGRRKPKKPKNIEPQVVDTEGLPELPEGWVWCKIENFISDFQPGFACGARDNCGYVQLRMNNIGLDGGVVLEKTLKVPIEKTNIEKYNLRMGDILFNNTNSVELIGKTALFMDEIQNCVFSNHITRIRPDVRVVTPKFLLYLFNDAYNKGIFRMMCHRFVGQAGISREKLLEHTLLLPPLLEQRAIVERVERLFHFVDEAEHRVAKATAHTEHLTHSILARAFRGELVPQDPCDEPASVLLERIKQERAKNEMEKKTGKRKTETLLDYC